MTDFLGEVGGALLGAVEDYERFGESAFLDDVLAHALEVGECGIRCD